MVSLHQRLVLKDTLEFLLVTETKPSPMGCRAVCFRVWHLPLGRKNWHVLPFIAGWFPCAGALYFIDSWVFSLSSLGIKWDFTHILNYQFSFIYLVSWFWHEDISKKWARAELDDSLSVLGMVVKIKSQHMACLNWLWYILLIWKKCTFMIICIYLVWL